MALKSSLNIDENIMYEDIQFRRYIYRLIYMRPVMRLQYYNIYVEKECIYDKGVIRKYLVRGE